MNPITRWREVLQWDKHELASFAKVDRAVITRIEQGLYTTIPPSLTKTLAKHSVPSHLRDAFIARVNEDYEQWVHDRRSALSLNLDGTLSEIVARYGGVNDFCILTCFPPILLNKALRGQNSPLLKELLRELKEGANRASSPKG